MNLCITFSHFEELYKNGYSVDMLFLLKLAQEGNDIKSLCEGNPKIGVLFQGIVRKGLLTEDSKLTLSGKAVLDILNKEVIEKPTLKRSAASVPTEDFERWWKAYPGTDTFTYKGKSFSGTRSMKRGRDDCKTKLSKILNEGEYTIDEMIAALEYEVLQKKENSYKASENKLKYMQNSLTYLNQRTFEPFIELIRENKTVDTTDNTSPGSVDV
jgi:hypothetical protein